MPEHYLDATVPKFNMGICFSLILIGKTLGQQFEG